MKEFWMAAMWFGIMLVVLAYIILILAVVFKPIT